MTTWFVRKSGSDSNGGSSASPTPDQQGTDGTILSGFAAFSAASANFQPGDVGKGIYIDDGVFPSLFRIVARSSTTAVTLDRVWEGDDTTTATWKMGGARLTLHSYIAEVVDLTTLVVGGDRVVIGAGTYQEIGLFDMASPSSELIIKGDVDGSETGDSGEVIWQGDPYLLDLADISNVTFEDLTFFTESGGFSIFGADPCGSNITWRRCAFISWSNGGTMTVPFGVNAAWLFDQCRWFVNYQYIDVSLTGNSSGSDYDANIVFRNCFMVCLQHGLGIGSDGVKRGGGVIVENCTMFAGSGEAVEITSELTSIPNIVRNSVAISGVNGLSAGAVGALVEDYNVVISAASPINVTKGAHSLWTADEDDVGPLFQIGQELAIGSMLRPFLSPAAGSMLIGFGSSSPPAVDLLNAPRPSAALAAIGAYERGNTFVRETGTVRSGLNALSIIGPGYHDFALPVDAEALTVSAYFRWDATYAGTKPKMQVLNGTECGVADATDTATGSSGAWEQLSLTFTPSAAGIVTIRFLSSDTNGGGTMFVDDYDVT